MSDYSVKCSRTERTDHPDCITRIRFKLGEAVIAPQAMLAAPWSSPFYRGLNDYGMFDSGDGDAA